MEKNKVTPCLYVSVESRKGGVGKTTAALCLARILKRKGYAVLVLDLDITGTNAADIAKSPFWENHLHVIQGHIENISVNRAANLIGMFDQHFLAGMSIPDFSTQSNTSKTLCVDLEKVNVFGSQIYNTEQADFSNKNNGITCIERPSILFDDLHTLWLLEFAKQITDNFIRVASNKGYTNSAIILDNSPGYVGIAPAIHEWLTDFGPECGKFLTVTSLDVQDLRACESSIASLHKLYQGKWRTSRIVMDGNKKGDGIDIDKDQESFFMRLASIPKGVTDSDGALAFYKSTELDSPQQYEKGQSYFDNPAGYIAIIINRVPKAVKEGQLLFDYGPFSLFNQGRNTLNKLLGDSNDERMWHRRMIIYDEYIENQFLLHLLQRRRRKSYEPRVHKLIDFLIMAEEKLHARTDESDNNLAGFLSLEYENHEQLRAELIRANEIISQARLAINDAQLSYLTDLIHDEWLPGSIVPNFRNALLRLLQEGDFPYFEMIPFEFDRASVKAEAREFQKELRERSRMELGRVYKNLNEINHRTIDMFTGILSSLVGLTLTTEMWNSPMRKEIAGLIVGILSIEIKHWTKRGEEKSAKSSVQRFLAQECVSRAELRKEIDMIKPLRFFRHQMMKEGEGSIVDFYRACTYSQARLIDFAADSCFLIQLIRFIVKGELEKGDLFPFVRGIAEDVIIKKTLSHKEAPNRIAKAIQTAEYFREFDGVLNEILKTWGTDV